MFDHFIFSSPARLDPSSHDSISPTNTSYVKTSHHTQSNSLQSTPSPINDLVARLGSQTLNSSYPSCVNGLSAPSPTRAAYSLLPVEDIDTKASVSSGSRQDIDHYYTCSPPLDQDQEMVHPNVLSSFLPQSADRGSRRTQRQILQEQQCRPTFTRDLQKLLQGMIERGDQCRLATSIMSSPPPSRGRDRELSGSSMGISPSHQSHHEATHEDEGFCETEDTFVSYASVFNTRSTSALPSTASINSRHSGPDSRKGSRHRRVASEGNIDIDFDVHGGDTYREISLRRAGAPIGIAKSSRSRGRGSTNLSPVTEWRKNVPRLRKSRKEMLRRQVT